MRAALRWTSGLLVLITPLALPAADDEKPLPWALRPVIRPAVPEAYRREANPIDAFIGARRKAHGLTPVGPADRRTLLRRVYLDLVGLPPSPAEQDAFLRDRSPDAYDKVVDRLLASEQHGVRYARHWLDVLRYADRDEGMPAAPGIHLWRDWVIRALNDDLPYDQFVRAQLTGQRSPVRNRLSGVGMLERVEPRPEDQFALGFLARGAVEANPDTQELAIQAVETVSTAFMGLTVGCAKCHDHMYDPITQRDFYAMKALFDPLVLRKVTLATTAEVFAHGRDLDEADRRREAVEASLRELDGPYRKKLYEDRLALLPAGVRAAVLKPEKQRTAREQKLADDYFPVLRIDPVKILEVLPADRRQRYQELVRQFEQLDARHKDLTLPAFWTVEVDPARALQKSYVLTSGDPARPQKDHEVRPGWPFAPATVDCRDGRVEAFSDWLTSADNPLLARVAVNRLWQWHFGEGLHKTPNDFGNLGGTPADPALLDWLAAEFVRCGFRMKAMHRLIVTSDAYRLASPVDPRRDAANLRADPGDRYLWHYRLRRLEAEPVWDSVFSAAGTLDRAVGGPSFDVGHAPGKGAVQPPVVVVPAGSHAHRRGAYLVRGYSSSEEVLPHFLQAFDVDDGRAPCPLRTQTVTVPQALFTMNSDAIARASERFAARLRADSGGDLRAAVDLGYRIALARPPSPAEEHYALTYLGGDPARLKGFAWLLFNLDEFVYVR
jgi:hypothetical protein